LKWPPLMSPNAAAKNQDGKAMRERDGRIMVDVKRYCRPGADKDQRKGADELGRQHPPNR
jgi:hypothetical protein